MQPGGGKINLTSVHKQTYRSVVDSLSSYRFTRSSLGTGHEISASRDDWDAMLLHRGRLHITRLADVFSQRLAQCCLFKSLKKKLFELLTQHHPSLIQQIKHTPASVESSHLLIKGLSYTLVKRHNEQDCPKKQLVKNIFIQLFF